MANRDAPAEPRFFFSLLRFVAKLRGGSGARSDKNWLEANVVGTAMHGIIYLCGAGWLLTGRPAWQQLLLLIPLAILLCLWWMLFFYVSSVLIKLLHALGFFRDFPTARVQGVLAGIMVTALAWQLVLGDSWMRLPGWIWLGAVSLNLVAALLLVLTDADGAAAR